MRAVLERFEAKYIPVPESGCWLWLGAKNTKGYGTLMVNEHTVYAHRVAYELFKDSIPEGFEVDHLCRVRSCVNPDHLEAVTPSENNRRGFSLSAINARKTHCPKGHPYDGINRTHGKCYRACVECRRNDDRHRQLRVRAMGIIRAKRCPKCRKSAVQHEEGAIRKCLNCGYYWLAKPRRNSPERVLGKERT